MPELQEQMYCSQQICIPPTFPYLLRQYAKAAIRCQPSDLLKWSTAYFRCLSLNLPPPLKPRLEYPVPKSYFGMTPGWLKALMVQLAATHAVTFRVLWDRWQGACLETDNLTQILVLAGFNDNQAVPWRRFIAACAAHLTDSLTHTMIMICEILTEEPEGGSAMIPLETFVDLYTFLSQIDASRDQRLKNLYFTDGALGLLPADEGSERVVEEEAEGELERVEEEAAPEDVAVERGEEEDLSVAVSCPDLQGDEVAPADLEDEKYGALALKGSAGFLPTVGAVDGELETDLGTKKTRSGSGVYHPDEEVVDLVVVVDVDVDVEVEVPDVGGDAEASLAQQSMDEDDVVVEAIPSQAFVVSDEVNETPQDVVEEEEKAEEGGDSVAQATSNLGLGYESTAAEEGGTSDAYASAVTVTTLEHDVEDTATTAAKATTEDVVVGEADDSDYTVGTGEEEQSDVRDETFGEATDTLPHKMVLSSLNECGDEVVAAEEEQSVATTARSEYDECEMVDVPAVAGIGPPVPLHMVVAVCDYLKEMAARQHGAVMPRNVMHYLCPPLETLLE